MNDLRSEIYWHLTDPEGILLHNAVLGEGWYSSVSHFAKGELENAVTLYSLFNADKEKERHWENIRLERFADRPSRLKAIFAFVSKEDAERAIREWFSNEVKIVVQMKVSESANVHVADARHLDSDRSQWREATILYWKGERTKDPRMEVVIDGRVYFPEWKQGPFGLISKQA